MEIDSIASGRKERVTKRVFSIYLLSHTEMPALPGNTVSMSSGQLFHHWKPTIKLTKSTNRLL